MPVSYNQIIKIINEFNYKIKSQRWSHKKFIKNNKSIIIPEHKELKPKTALSIIKLLAKYENKDYKTIIKDYNLKI